MLRLVTTYSRILSIALAGAIVAFGLSACDSGGGPGDDGTLDVGFQYASSSSSSSSVQAKSSHESMEIIGNGDTLSVRDIRFIVEDFKIDGEEDSLDFNAPPAFLDLPLNQTDFAAAGSYNVPPGTYVEFEFEVDDLDPDDDDSEQERQQIEELLGQIREDFPDFPSDASMIVIGTFTPENGDPREFTTFIEAEVEVEREFDSPLEVTGDGLSRSLTVQMDPVLWFTTGDGGVRNLAERQGTDDLLEIETEFEESVVEIEIADDD